MATFEVALSSDFREPDGSPAFPSFDLSPLFDDPAIRVRYVDAIDGVTPAAALEDVDALILLTHRFDASSVPRSGRLALVARFGVGYDSVDVPACTAADIALAITPDGVRRPVAVAVLTFMLALAGRLMIKDRLTRSGPEGWHERIHHFGNGLVGRTLGQIGLGNIGAEVFRVAAPLGMRFIAHDPHADAALARSLGVELVDLDTLFRESDYLSVACALTAETRGLVDARRLALMKPTAFLINTARGPIVDQKALTEALAARRIAGAGLDVFEKEPPDPDDPLLKLDNVILAPHSLCWTDQCFGENGAADIRAVRAVMHGREPATVVNRAVLQSERWKARLAGYRQRFGD